MKKYRYILLDLDGTLVLSHPGIFAGIRHALREMGRTEEPKQEVLRKCIGPSLTYTFSHFFGMTETEAIEATAKYRAWYAEEGMLQCTPVEGALEALHALQAAGYTLAMATSKPKVFAEKIAVRFGFEKYLSALVGCGLNGSLPTKAAVIEEAMRRLGASADECLMVGDTQYDAEGAKEQGVDCALLAVGYGDEAAFAAAQPRYTFKNFVELVAFLTAEGNSEA